MSDWKSLCVVAVDEQSRFPIHRFTFANWINTWNIYCGKRKPTNAGVRGDWISLIPLAVVHRYSSSSPRQKDKRMRVEEKREKAHKQEQTRREYHWASPNPSNDCKHINSHMMQTLKCCCLLREKFVSLLHSASDSFKTQENMIYSNLNLHLIRLHFSRGRKMVKNCDESVNSDDIKSQPDDGGIFLCFSLFHDLQCG